MKGMMLQISCALVLGPLKLAEAFLPHLMAGYEKKISNVSSSQGSIGTTKTVFYNSAQTPQMPGCVLRRFETRTRTNWQYECANAFVDGVIDAGAYRLRIAER